MVSWRLLTSVTDRKMNVLCEAPCTAAGRVRHLWMRNTSDVVFHSTGHLRWQLPGQYSQEPLRGTVWGGFRVNYVANYRYDPLLIEIKGKKLVYLGFRRTVGEMGELFSYKVPDL